VSDRASGCTQCVRIGRLLFESDAMLAMIKPTSYPFEYVMENSNANVSIHRNSLDINASVLENANNLVLQLNLNYPHSIVILPKYCHSVVMQYRNIHCNNIWMSAFCNILFPYCHNIVEQYIDRINVAI